MAGPRRLRRVSLSALFAVLALAATKVSAHGAANALAAADAPVEVRVPRAPTPVAGSDGRTHLAYELHVTNFYRDTGTLRLRRVAVFADADTAPLAAFDGAALARIVTPRAGDDASADPVPIAAGLRAVVFVWLTLPDGRAPPRTLRHRLEFENAAGHRDDVDGVRVDVSAASPPVLGPPLRGGAWLVVEGPGNANSHHWGSLVAVNGALTIPQRYALDLFGLDDDGRLLRAGVDDWRRSKREDWIGEGADVLAVADGTVRAVRDGQREHVPLASQPEPTSLSADGLYGNYVVLQIAPATFVHYAHLQRGSVRVAPGQRVRRGAVLGRLGQSGNANGPHLHIQVSDAVTFEGSEGLPFVFDAFASPGAWSVTQALDRAAHLDRARPPHARQMPLDGDALIFDAPAPR